MHRIFIASIFLCILTLASCCPNPEKLVPCTCQQHGFLPVVICPNLENNEALLHVVYALKDLKKFYSFVLEKGNFVNIPHNIFQYIKFQELEIRSSSFMGLTDTDVAFEGLEEELVSLVITDSIMLNDWDWTVLRKLKRLLKLQIDLELELISEEVAELDAPHLSIINLANNKIEEIYDKAFAKYTRLLSISLRNNLISEVKRSMIPNPAVLLTSLDLSGNKLEELPSDMFNNLPSLEILNIGSNRFLTLDEKTFSGVWSNLQLTNVTDNDLRCDCRLSWILKQDLPGIVYADCYSPASLRGKQLVDLTEVDLWC